MEGEKPYLCSICVSNFKAFGVSTELELNQLTLLAGLNSSGKSTIYQALLLLAQSSDYYYKSHMSQSRIPRLNLNERYIEIGNIDDLLFNKRKKAINFKLTWSNESSIELEFSQTAEPNIDKDGNNSKIMALSKYCYRGNDSEVLLAKSKSDKWGVDAKNCLSFSKYHLFEIIRKHICDNAKQNNSVLNEEDLFCNTVSFDDIISFGFRENTLFDINIRFEDIIKCIKPIYRKYVDISALKEVCSLNNIDPSKLSLMISEFIEHKRSVIDNNTLTYIPPFRGYPRRLYMNTTSQNPLINYQYVKNRVIPYRYSTENRSAVNGTVEEAMQYWIVDYLQLANKLIFRDIIPGVASEVFLASGKNKISINNVGFGTSQIIPIVYKILTSKRDLIIVDEPEIHLHASIQSKLATFFYEMVLLGKRLLIETHSEYLIDKIIYHNILNQDDCSPAKLCWVIKTEKGSEIINIQHDDLGYIINSPDGFLSEKSKLVNELNAVRMSKL